jgi:hypothetical protein
MWAGVRSRIGFAALAIGLAACADDVRTLDAVVADTPLPGPIGEARARVFLTTVEPGGEFGLPGYGYAIFLNDQRLVQHIGDGAVFVSALPGTIVFDVFAGTYNMRFEADDGTSLAALDLVALAGGSYNEILVFGSSVETRALAFTDQLAVPEGSVRVRVVNTRDIHDPIDVVREDGGGGMTTLRSALAYGQIFEEVMPSGTSSIGAKAAQGGVACQPCGRIHLGYPGTFGSSYPSWCGQSGPASGSGGVAPELVEYYRGVPVPPR